MGDAAVMTPWARHHAEVAAVLAQGRTDPTDEAIYHDAAELVARPLPMEGAARNAPMRPMGIWRLGSRIDRGTRSHYAKRRSRERRRWRAQREAARGGRADGSATEDGALVAAMEAAP